MIIRDAVETDLPVIVEIYCLPFPTAWQHLTWSRCLLKVVSAGFLNTPTTALFG